MPYLYVGNKSGDETEIGYEHVDVVNPNVSIAN